MLGTSQAPPVGSFLSLLTKLKYNKNVNKLLPQKFFPTLGQYPTASYTPPLSCLGLALMGNMSVPGPVSSSRLSWRAPRPKVCSTRLPAAAQALCLYALKLCPLAVLWLPSHMQEFPLLLKDKPVLLLMQPQTASLACCRK